jgi:tetratricopeptide (TPR) repeat protein
MTATGQNFHNRNRTLTLSTIVVLGFVGIVLLARWIDARRPAPDAVAVDESLYLSGPAAKRLSLAFNGLAADWYWMRSLQYVGRKVLSVPEDVVLDDLSSLNLKLLAPLLDNATTLDPHFLEPYEYAALVLPSVDLNEAIRLTNKGIAANPNAWRLYQHLGYIYWQQHDYKTASEVYHRGAQIPGAPAWMEAMSARMQAEGGSRSVAREIYGRMYEQAGDLKIRDMAQRRLWQLDYWDQRDVMQKLLPAYQARFGRCPASWQEIATILKALKWRVDGAGAPVDPSGTPYRLVQNGCEMTLDATSGVPAK